MPSYQPDPAQQRNKVRREIMQSISSQGHQATTCQMWLPRIRWRLQSGSLLGHDVRVQQHFHSQIARRDTNTKCIRQSLYRAITVTFSCQSCWGCKEPHAIFNHKFAYGVTFLWSDIFTLETANLMDVSHNQWDGLRNTAVVTSHTVFTESSLIQPYLCWKGSLNSNQPVSTERSNSGSLACISLYNHKWQKKCFLQCFDAVNCTTGRHPAHNAECHCTGHTRSVTAWPCLSGIEGAALITSQLLYPVCKAALLMVMVHDNYWLVYLSDSVQPPSSNPACRRRRSVSSLDFIVPRTRTESGDRASLLPVWQCGTVCLSLLDQLRL